MNIIETVGLSFKYSSQNILDCIDLKVPSGSIYGYLGKNGAGKSTTIKLLLGLLESSTGTLSIFNQDYRSHRTTILDRIGNLIESPSFYPHMTAYENLKYLSLCRHCKRGAIDEVLHTVGLSGSAHKKAKIFSTGMKQRLGIAMVLLHDPDLLILDEPLNGLDAEGIVQIRELLRTLQCNGKTIFFSSHILSEMEKICSHVGILDGGRLIFQGRMEELFNTVAAPVVLEVDRPIEAAQLCQQHGFKVTMHSSKPAEMNLETIFLKLTEPTSNDRKA